MECGLQRPPTGRPETDSRVGDGADRASLGGPLPPPAVGGAAPALQARRMLGGSLTGAKSGGRLRQALLHCGAQCRTPSWALLLGADAVPSPACTPSPLPHPPAALLEPAGPCSPQAGSGRTEPGLVPAQAGEGGRQAAEQAPAAGAEGCVGRGARCEAPCGPGQGRESRDFCHTDHRSKAPQTSLGSHLPHESQVRKHGET